MSGGGDVLVRGVEAREILGTSEIIEIGHGAPGDTIERRKTDTGGDVPVRGVETKETREKSVIPNGKKTTTLPPTSLVAGIDTNNHGSYRDSYRDDRNSPSHRPRGGPSSRPAPRPPNHDRRRPGDNSQAGSKGGGIDPDERARKLAAMQQAASELDRDRERRLAALQDDEKKDREADEKARQRLNKVSGGGHFLNGLRHKASGMDLAESIGRGRQGLQLDEE
jgi:hypothetical protein